MTTVAVDGARNRARVALCAVTRTLVLAFGSVPAVSVMSGRPVAEVQDAFEGHWQGKLRDACEWLASAQRCLAATWGVGRKRKLSLMYDGLATAVDDWREQRQAEKASAAQGTP